MGLSDQGPLDGPFVEAYFERRVSYVQNWPVMSPAWRVRMGATANIVLCGTPGGTRSARQAFMG